MKFTRGTQLFDDAQTFQLKNHELTWNMKEL